MLNQIKQAALLPKLITTQPSLFTYCVFRAWLALPFVLSALIVVLVQNYNNIYSQIQLLHYPSWLNSLVPAYQYQNLIAQLPLPIFLNEQQLQVLHYLFIGLLVAAGLMFLAQIHSLLKQAERKAWNILKGSEKQKNHSKKIRTWKKGMRLLTPEARQDLINMFPDPRIEATASKPDYNAIDYEAPASSSENENRQQSPKNSQGNTQKVLTNKGSQEKHIQRIEPRRINKTQNNDHQNTPDSKATVITPINEYGGNIGESSIDDAVIQTKLTAQDLPFTIGADQRYALEGEIAKGGMGTVYGGKDKTLQRLIAVKQLHQHLTSDPEQVDRFKQEALLLARLNHPNIVPIYDLIDYNEQVWIVMEWLQGGSLEDLIEAGPINVKLSIQIVKSIADALAKTHEHGIIHRDIKPMNILLTEDNIAKLTDFGTAKFSQASVQTQEGLAIGSPSYMSPEQASGQALDVRSDIYSLGITLYQLTVGDVPFKGDSISVMSQQITQQAAEPIKVKKGFNKTLSKVIMKMIAKEPEKRFQSMQEIKQTLDKFNI